MINIPNLLKKQWKWLFMLAIPLAFIIISFVFAANPTYELLIKKNQTGTSATGAYEVGDIIMIKPEGYNWSSAERQNFYYVKIQLSQGQLKQFVNVKERDTGEVDENGEPIMELQKRRKYNLDVQGLYNGKTIAIQDIVSK